jgi:putative transcriptional regulator
MQKNRSPVLEAVHETARGLARAGAIDHVTLYEFDRMCLPPIHRTTSLFDADEPKT